LIPFVSTFLLVSQSGLQLLLKKLEEGFVLFLGIEGLANSFNFCCFSEGKQLIT